ncbi:MAG: sugar phosphate isomerase/epimerase family protein [bacterium]
MRIGFVTDEISLDVEEAIRVGTAWRVRDYELRMIGEDRIPNITEKQIYQILQLQKNFGIHITALSPGIFKSTVREETQIKQELEEILPQTIQQAKILGAKTIIVFGFLKSELEPAEHEEKVVEMFKLAAESAWQHGLILAVENELGFWCDNGQNTARILSKVNSPAFRANWDPANTIGTDETPYPHGYENIKKWIANVHVKDTIKNTLVECVPVGQGKVDWPGQLQALVQDRVVDHVTIETHCLPLLEKSEQNLKTVREILKTR